MKENSLTAVFFVLILGIFLLAVLLMWQRGKVDELKAENLRLETVNKTNREFIHTLLNERREQKPIK